MIPDQFRLVARRTAPWLTLWLIADFESGRTHAVGSMAGGTYGFADGARGQYETTGRGMAAWRRDRSEPEITVAWAEVGRWVRSLPETARETAATLRREGQQIQADYPPAYPGIGRPYCWDGGEQHVGPDCEQCAIDRADLDAANEQRAERERAWRARRAEHDARVAAFLASIAPVEVEPEPDLLDLIGAA